MGGTGACRMSPGRADTTAGVEEEGDERPKEESTWYWAG